LLTAIGLTPGGSNRVHIYTRTIHRINTRKTKHFNIARVPALVNDHQALYKEQEDVSSTYAVSRWLYKSAHLPYDFSQNCYEGWNFNSGNYLFTTDTK